ncbi:MAG: amino acid ABC transporter ATP-binding protein [Clostridia bacterium]|nr:amino acid ABC transporter ATP-binding protein [Clostridia bacterium]
MAFLEVKNVKKSFGNTEVLKGIDFSLERGQVLSIIGSSGSGKTTLLRVINHLETADEGFATVGKDIVLDASVKKLSEKELREMRLKFGLVFQSFNLFPQYNVKKNLTLAAELRAKEALGKKASKEELAERYSEISDKADALLEKVGLTEKAESYPCELSGGQCQRVAIARALMLEPEILCFDEPTSALDPELTGEVLKVIKSLKSGEHTMIIVTHEMEFAKNVSDKIIFMSEGVIEEEGTPEEIFGNPKSEKLKSFLFKENF